MPVAVNCWVCPLVMLGLTGVTAIETRAAGVTVSVSSGLTMLPRVAVITIVPGEREAARPEALIVATATCVEVQVTWLERFCVELSV